MLEDDYSRQLKRILESCECDVAVAGEWEACLGSRDEGLPSEEARRKHSRFVFKVPAVLEYEQSLPGIPREHTIASVLTRDLAREGIGFFYSDELYPGECISLWLASGKRMYRVVRCLQLRDDCFEIGAVLFESRDQKRA